MAISLNGIIATSDNREEFLSDENWEEFVKAAKQRGCLIWGRKTYEMLQAWDPTYLEPLKNITKVIISSDPKIVLADGFIHASSPAEAIRVLKNKNFGETILTGGSKNNSSFAKLGLIDEVILDIEGIVIGKGIPLFDPMEFELKLNLIDIKKITSNIIQAHYQVKKN